MTRNHKFTGVSASRGTDVVLVFPPPWSPFQPYSSLAYLAGSLLAVGFKCIAIDASLEFYDYYLRPDILSECDKHSTGGLERRQHENGMPNSEVIRSAFTVKEILRGEHFYEPQARATAINILIRALSIAASPFRDCVLRLDDCTGQWQTKNSEKAVQCALSPPPNPFSRFYERKIIPLIREQYPKILGISIVTPAQAFPALLLAQMVRESLPSINIVVGGPLLTASIQKRAVADHAFLKIADHIILGEGESALVDLSAMILGKDHPCHSKTKHTASRSGACTRIIRGAKEDLNSLPPPAYHILPLDRYYSPEPILTLLTSRGCYWNRCQFCDIPGIGKKHNYRMTSPETVIKHVEHAAATTGARCFAFWDNAVPPQTLRVLSEHLVNTRKKFFWYAQIRADRSFDAVTCGKMYEAGCRQVYMGIETASQPLLNKMNKGLRIVDIRRIATNFRRSGIIPSGGYMMGYPRETDTDVKRTLRFICENRDILYPSTRNVGVFTLRKGSLIHNRARQEGIVVTEPTVNDLALDLEYVVTRQSSQQRLERALDAHRFLKKRGFDGERFGAHYLLYQVRNER